MGFGAGVSPDQRASEGQIGEEMLALITQVTNEVTWYMREQGLSRAELATRMGVSPGRVSQILGGGENLTLRTLAALSAALGARFELELGAVTGATVTGGPAPDALAPAANRRVLSRSRHHDSAGH